MKTITDLSKLDGRVYVYLNSDELARTFLENAEAEGFTFGDGILPTERQVSNIFALNSNSTINYVGINGHIAFQAADEVAGRQLIRIDYEKFINGSDPFYIRRR